MPARYSFQDRRCLERNLVVHVPGLAGAGQRRLAFARRARSGTWAAGTEVIAAVGTRAAAAAGIEHGELRIEALQHHFGRVAVVAVLVLPFARLQRAFQVNLRALLEILLDDLAQALVEDHHPVPLGFFLALAGGLVAPAFRGGHPQIRDRTAVLGAANFRIRTEIADEDHLVDATCHDTSPPGDLRSRDLVASRRRSPVRGPPAARGPEN